MTAMTNQLLEAALQLPDDEQTALVDALVAAAAKRRSLPFSQAWLPELERRWKEYEADKSKVYTWAEAWAYAKREVEDDD